MITKYMKDYIISSIAFQDDVVELTYFDRNKQGDYVAQVTTLVIETNKFGEENFRVIIDELVDIINDAQVSIRKPPDKLDPVQRLKQGLSAREDEEDSDDEGQELA